MIAELGIDDEPIQKKRGRPAGIIDQSQFNPPVNEEEDNFGMYDEDWDIYRGI